MAVDAKVTQNSEIKFFDLTTWRASLEKCDSRVFHSAFEFYSVL
jgi:hypothetical protein